MKQRKMEVTCTDRGAHPRRLLGQATFNDDAPGLASLMRGAERERKPRKGADRIVTNFEQSEHYWGKSGQVLRFTCPTCQRDVRLSESRLRQIADGGVATLDVSVLPANLQ